MTQSRQLAAIMFTDIVGYTALMGEDEQKAFKLLKKNRQVQRPIIEKHNGRWLKEIGDGILASFSTVSDAVYCACELQEACLYEPDLKLRIGIHQGEVVFEGNDVFGDGVNIASRLEPLAPIGGILISESVNRNIGNKPDIHTSFQREEQLKGVKDPVKTYQVLIDGIELPRETPVSTVKKRSAMNKVLGTAVLLIVAVGLYFALRPIGSSDQPTMEIEMEKSIAVLPFRDISPNKDQEWFGDGMMEAVLDHLVKIPGLKVTSRTSVMQYKETVKTVPEILRELGVSYLLEGGVQVVGEDVRITAQLIDVNDQHLWSEQFDRPYEGVFAIQTEIAERIAITLQAAIGDEVKERINRIPTDNLEAYNSFLKARSIYGSDESWELFERAIELDPNFSEAYTLYGSSWYFSHTWSGHDTLTNQDIIDKSYRLLTKAIELDPGNAVAHYYLGGLYCYALLDLKRADIEYNIAQKLSPSNPQMTNPEFLLSIGRFSEALLATERILDANPTQMTSRPLIPLYFNKEFKDAIKDANQLIAQYPGQGNIVYAAGRIFLWTGEYKKVVELYEQYPIDFIRITTNAVIAYYHLGQQEKVDSFIKHLKSITNGIGSPAYCLGLIYAQMGETEEAFKWLDQAWEERQGELYWLKYEPTWEPIRDDPRFQELVDKIGYPEA